MIVDIRKYISIVKLVKGSNPIIVKIIEIIKAIKAQESDPIEAIFDIFVIITKLIKHIGAERGK